VTLYADILITKKTRQITDGMVNLCVKGKTFLRL